MTQNKLKKYSEIISIISQVLWIIITIFTIFIAIFGTITSFIFSRIELDNNGDITIYNITINPNEIINYIPEESKSSVDDIINYFKTFINENTKSQKFLMLETFVILATAELILFIMILYNIHHLFKNISIKDTPFIKENPHKLRYICLLLLIIIIIDYLGNKFIYSLYNINFSNGFNLFILYIIFIIYTLSYLFEYGHHLELKYNKLKEGDKNEK